MLVASSPTWQCCPVPMRSLDTLPCPGGQRDAVNEHLLGDPEWFDAKTAGWWVWGKAAALGSFQAGA